MLTHELLNGFYLLKLNNRLVGRAIKAKGGFVLVEDQGTKPKSMRELKQQVFDLLSFEERFPSGQEEDLSFLPNPTQKDWQNFTSISHTGTYVYLREARKMQPDKKGPELYKYLIRKYVESLAGWQMGHSEWARQWLKDHPSYGAYDKVEEAHRLEDLYPTREENA